MKSSTLLLLIILFPIASYGQKVANYDGDGNRNQSSGMTELGSFGFGAGIDYGALGIKLTVIPEKHIGVFFGGGIMGYNIGGNIRLQPARKITPTLSGMYGLNAIIFSQGTSGIIFKGYKGYSVGLGAEAKVGKRNNFWKLELLVPFHSAEFENDVRYYNSNGYDISKPWPVVFSFGFHLAISN